LLYPDLLLIKGRTEEAVAMSKAAFDLDPFSPRTGKALAHVYFFARKYDEALEQSRKTLELFPDHPMIFLGPIYEQKGMYDQAVDGYLQTEKHGGLSEIKLASLRQAYANSGWRGFWQKRLDLLKAEAKKTPAPNVWLAELHGRVGDADSAFALLDKAFAEHDMSLIFLTIDPSWESLRSDRRFNNLLQRMALNPRV
jgi:tetratricopeptide (TPR) repeat protein